MCPQPPVAATRGCVHDLDTIGLNFRIPRRVQRQQLLQGPGPPLPPAQMSRRPLPVPGAQAAPARSAPAPRHFPLAFGDRCRERYLLSRWWVRTQLPREHTLTGAQRSQPPRTPQPLRRFFALRAEVARFQVKACSGLSWGGHPHLCIHCPLHCHGRERNGGPERLRNLPEAVQHTKSGFELGWP